MAKSIFISAVAAILALAGTANAETKEFDLSGFNEVSVSTGIKAEIEVGIAYSIIAESSEKGLERLAVEVDGSVLKLKRRNRGMSWGRGENVLVRISMPDLEGLDASSGASIYASGIDTEDFLIDASSGARVKAAGSCQNLSIDVSSGSEINAEKLKCRTAKADASSGARAILTADDSISADASSGAYIKVYGSPEEIVQDTSSGGRVKIERR